MMMMIIIIIIVIIIINVVVVVIIMTMMIKNDILYYLKCICLLVIRSDNCNNPWFYLQSLVLEIILSIMLVTVFYFVNFQTSL